MSNQQRIPAATGRPVRRLCIAVDLEHYSQRPDSAQVEAQRAMSNLLREAGQDGALERAQWDIQPQGDGELALLPPGIDEGYVITSLMRQISAGLHRHNRHANPLARLRMRIAVHEGPTYIAESGFAGDAVNTVCRLRDATETKGALKNADGDVVLIVSERIFRDVICGDDTYDLPPDSFRKTEIVMADKGFRALAFIYAGHAAGGQPLPEHASPAKAAGTQAGAPAHGSASFTFGDHTSVGGIAGRDMYNGYPPGWPAIRPTDEDSL